MWFWGGWCDLSDPEDENDPDYVPPANKDLLPPLKRLRHMNMLVEVSSDLYHNPFPSTCPAKSKQRNGSKRKACLYSFRVSPDTLCLFQEALHWPDDWAYNWAYQPVFSSTDWGHMSTPQLLLFSSLQDYWAVESCFAPVADTMPVKCWKCFDNLSSSTTTSKWRAALTASTRSVLFLTCSERNVSSFPPTNRQGVGEVMVAYKGARAGKLRQYIQNKPNTWVFKIFCQGSSSGMIHKFVLYQVSIALFNIQEEGHACLGLKDLLLSAKIVSILCNPFTNK